MVTTFPSADFEYDSRENVKLVVTTYALRRFLEQLVDVGADLPYFPEDTIRLILKEAYALDQEHLLCGRWVFRHDGGSIHDATMVPSTSQHGLERLEERVGVGADERLVYLAFVVTFGRALSKRERREWNIERGNHGISHNGFVYILSTRNCLVTVLHDKEDQV
jgi:hypothetical protein